MENTLGEDLSIDMLSQTPVGEEDFVLDVPATTTVITEDEAEKKKKELEKTTISEGGSPESVAGEEGKETSENSKISSPDAGDKLALIYSSLATHLNEAGVLPSLNLEENKITSQEDFEKAIKTEITNGLDEGARRYREALEKGEPEDAYIRYTRQKEQYSKLTDDVISDPDANQLRFNIIATDFVNRGFDKEDAMKHAKRSQDLGEDTTDAIKSLERIRETNETEYQTAVKEKEQSDLEAVNSVKKFIDSTDEVIKGIKLTQATKDNLLKQMTTAVKTDSKGNAVTAYGEALEKDPVKTKVISEYLFLVTKGFTDFSKINTLIASKTTSKLDDILRNTGADFLGGGGVGKTDDQTSFSIGDGLSLDI